MASELSKLIEDQLQKVDEEAGMTPTEKQRLLSSSLRIKVRAAAMTRHHPFVFRWCVSLFPAHRGAFWNWLPLIELCEHRELHHNAMRSQVVGHVVVCRPRPGRRTASGLPS